MTPNAQHEAYMAELKACLGSAGADLPADQLLAVTAQFVGMLVAAQDQRTMTPSRAMQIVAGNLEVGNATAVEGLLAPRGSA